MRRKFLKKAVAVVLSASMLLGSCSSAFAAEDLTQVPVEAETVTETVVESLDEPADSAVVEALPEGEDAAETVAEEVPEAKQYIILLPEGENVSYSLDQEHRSSEYSTDSYSVLLYEEGQHVSIRVDSKLEYYLTSDAGGSLFRSYSDFSDGCIEFDMPALDLEMMFRTPETEAPQMEAPAQSAPPATVTEIPFEEQVAEEEILPDDMDDLTAPEAPVQEEQEEASVTETPQTEAPVQSAPPTTITEIPFEEQVAEEEILPDDMDDLITPEEEVTEAMTEMEEQTEADTAGMEAVETELETEVQTEAQTDEEQPEAETEEKIDDDRETEIQTDDETEVETEIETEAVMDITEEVISAGVYKEDLEGETYLEYLPETGSHVDARGDYYVWRYDTWFDGKGFAPEFFYSNEADLYYESGDIDFSKEGDNLVVFRAVSVYDPERYWFVDVVYHVTNSKALVTVGSDNWENRMFNEQSPSLRGIVPEFVGEVVDGGTFTVVKGTGADPALFDLGYDDYYYSVSVQDDGGFDPDTVGSYEVLYAAYSNWQGFIFYVKTVVNVVEAEDAFTGNGVSVKIASGFLMSEVEDANGTLSRVGYGDTFVSESALRKITVTPRFAFHIYPTVSVTRNGEAADDVVASAVLEDDVYTVTFNPFDAADASYVVTLDYPDPDPKDIYQKMTGGVMTEDDMIVESIYDPMYAELSTDDAVMAYSAGIEEAVDGGMTSEEYVSDEAAPAMANTLVGTASAGGYSAGYVSWDGVTCGNHFIFIDSGSNHFTVSSAPMANTLKAKLQSYGVEITGSMPSCRISCVSGHDYAGINTSTAQSYLRCSANFYDTDGDGKPNRIQLYYSVPMLTVQGYGTQGFGGSTWINLKVSGAKVKLHKTSFSPNWLTTFSNYKLNATFTVYEVNGKKAEEVEQINLEPNADGTVKDTYVVLPAGDYYVVENSRSDGHAHLVDDKGNLKKIYFTVTEDDVKNNKTVVIDDPDNSATGIRNYALYYNGALVRKITNDGTKTPLKGAVFKVVMNYNNGEDKRTYYFETDKNGLVYYDEKHLYSGTNAKWKSDALWPTYRDSIGYAVPYLTEVTVKEVKAPDGYVITDTASKTYEIKKLLNDNGLVEEHDLANVKDYAVSAGTFKDDQEENGQAYVQIVKVPAVPANVAGNPVAYSLEGAQFKIYDSKDNCVATITTKADGTTDPVQLDLGTYDVKETIAPPGYYLRNTEYSFTLTKDHKDNTAATALVCKVPETEKSGKLCAGVLKYDAKIGESKPLADAQFTVKYYGSGSATGTPIRTWVFKTDTDGKIDFSEYALYVSGDELYWNENKTQPVYPIGNYTIQESLPPEGYEINKTVVPLSITLVDFNTTKQTAFRDVFKYPETEESLFGKISVSKKDAQSLSAAAQGNAMLDGTVVNVVVDDDTDMFREADKNVKFKKGQVITTITISNGTGTSESISLGKYKLVEATAPTGYRLNTTYSAGVTLTTKGVTVPASDLVDNVVRGSVMVQKKDAQSAAGVAEGDATLEGTVFEIYNYSKNAVYVDVNRNGAFEATEVFAPKAKICEITTDAAGEARTPAEFLPFGYYLCTEKTPPKGYTSNGSNLSKYFFITEDKKEVQLAGADATSNDVIRGSVMIQKKDADSSAGAVEGDATLEGAVFEIFNKSKSTVYVDVKQNGTFEAFAPNEKICEITTNAVGIARTPFVFLPYGSYSYSEKTPPKGYAAEGTNLTGTFEIRENGVEVKLENEKAVSNKAVRGSVMIKKQDADHPAGTAEGNAILKGAVFEIFNQSANAIYVDVNQNGTFETSELFPPKSKICEIKTDEAGEARTPANFLPYGSYSYSEKTPPLGYTANGSNLTGTFMIRSSDEVKLDANSAVYNKVIRGAFKVAKWDATWDEAEKLQGDASLEGAVFEIYNKSAADVCVDVNQNGTLEANEIFAPGAKVCEIKTNASGIASTPDKFLPFGYYTYQEVTPPKGYTEVGRNRSGAFSISTDGQVADWTNTYTAARNEVMRGSFAIQKRDVDLNAEGKTQGDAVLEGTVIALYNKSVESVYVDINQDGVYSTSELFAPGAKILELKTDAKGNASTPEKFLPYGTYSYEELTPPKGYTMRGKNLKGTFSIRKDGEKIERNTDTTSIMNEVIRGDIALFKFEGTKDDGEDSKDYTPLSGITFEIYLASNKAAGPVVTLVTDKLGFASTKGLDKAHPAGYLPYGKYIVHEVASSVPSGLEVVDDWEVFVGATADVQGDPDKDALIFGDKNQYIDGHVYKGFYKNDKVTEIPVRITKVSSVSNALIAEPGFEFQILDENHSIMTFEVKTNHGIKYVTNFVTDETGTYVLEHKLAKGTYYIHEVNAPYGCVLSADKQFTVSSWGSWYDTDQYQSERFADDFQYGQITITKLNAVDNSALSGAVFQVIADEDIYTVDTKDETDLDTVKTRERILRYKKGEVVDTVTIGPDGTGTSKQFYIGTCDKNGNVTAAKYHVEEIKAPEGFYLDTEKIPFSFDYAGQTIPIVTKGTEVKNRATTLKMFKTDIDGVALEGVKFSFTKVKDIPSSGIAYKNSVAGGIFTTDKNGELFIQYLVSGLYEVKEIETLPGYLLSKDVRYVKVDTNGYIAETDKDGNVRDVSKTTIDSTTCTLVMNWKNDYTKWDFSKVNVNGDYEIPGASMKILDKDGNIVKVLNKDNSGYETLSWVSDGTVKRINKIPLGKYTLVEVSAPKGWTLNTVAVPFEVTDTGVVQLCQMWDKQVFMTKVDVTGDNEVPGAKIQVFDMNNKLMDEWTSGDGPHPISNLKNGESYILHEEVTPDGYVTATDIKFTVNHNRVDQQIKMIDKQVFMSKVDVTGEKEIPGAKIQVFDKAGKLVDEWISEEAPHAIKNLKAGEKYILHEEVAADGYVVASDIEFEVKDDGKNQTEKMIDKQVFMSKVDVTGEKEVPGASIQVLDQNNKVVDAWISAEEPHAIRNLVVGNTYTLHEEAASAGYVVASDITFEVKDDGQNQEIKMVDKQVFMSKVDVTGEKEIPGAKIQVFDLSDNLMDEWVSEDTPHAISNLKVGNSYRLHEEVAAEGYVVASDIIFDVTDDGKNQTVTMVDKQVFMSKVDVTGENEIPGAKIQVLDANKKVVDEWISEDKPHAISNLVVGNTYTLHEEVAAEGYVVASDIVFDVTDDGKNQQLTMVDKQMFMSKVDVTGENEIPGAKIAVYDKDWNLMDSWTSGDKPHAINNLKVNNIYTLVEEVAAEGYVKATSIDFTVKDDGENQLVTMIDKQVFMSKVDITGENEIPGASIQVTDEGGDVVDSWVSGDKPHAISGLEVGRKYKLHEEVAPNGYVKASDVEFTVTDDGTDQTVKMVDKQVWISKQDLTNGKEIAGAHLAVTDKDGNVVDQWVSVEDEKHPVSGLEVGKTYVLTETKPADGFVTAEQIEFTVLDDGVDEIHEMLDDITKVSISKKDITNKEELPGATLQILDKDGNVIEEWISEDQPHYIERLPIGEYTLIEITAPLGYDTAEEVQFEVKDTGEIQHVEMFDVPWREVHFSKKDITDSEELPGATLQLLNEKGDLLEEWVSEDQPHMIFLTAGKYKLVEITAPDGYATAEEIEFEVLGRLTDGDFDIQHVEMFDSPTKIEISKQDITTKKELPGATLVIKDKDGKEIERWVSTNEPHMIEKLPVGDYTLTEITAPNGYAVSEVINFSVLDTAEIQHVVMYDSPVPAGGNKIVRTGDNLNVIPLAVSGMAILLLLIAAFVLLRKKKKN